MKQIAALLLVVLALLFSLPMAFAVGEGGAGGSGADATEVKLTVDNWVEYFSVERFDRCEIREFGPETRFGHFDLEYRLVLRQQYRDLLAPGTEQTIRIQFTYSQNTGLYDVDYDAGSVFDSGSIAASRRLDGEAAVTVSSPYMPEEGNLLTSGTILCSDYDGTEFGSLCNSFTMTAVEGSLFLLPGLASDGPASAPEEELVAKGISGNVRWKLDKGGTMTVYGEGDMGSCISGKPWEEYTDAIRAVVIEEGVKSIGSHAFYHCRHIHEVSLPNTLTRIENSAFFDCNSLQKITLPASVVWIGDQVFTADSSLGFFDVHPDNPAFSSEGNVLYNRDCSKLICCTASVDGVFTVPEGVKEIAEHAFRYDRELTSVKLPATVARIGDSAFMDCSSMTSVIWDGTLQNWEKVDIARGNDELLGAELLYTRLGTRPSVGEMETLVDDGTLKILARDHSMEVELSNITVENSYVMDQSGSEKGLSEYSWGIMFSDGQHSYWLQTLIRQETPASTELARSMTWITTCCSRRQRQAGFRWIRR